MRILALLDSQRTKTLFRKALEELRRSHGCRSWDPAVLDRDADPLGALSATRPHVALLDSQLLRDPPGVLEEMLNRRGACAMALWTSPDWPDPARVLELGRLGLADILVKGKDDSPRELAARLQRLAADQRSAEFLGALPPDLPSSISVLVLNLMLPGNARADPTELAKRACCDRTTLYRRFRKAGLPPPREFVGWMRAYTGLRLVEEGIPTEKAARRVGFASSSGFRSLVARRLGPARGQGAPELLTALSERCREVRREGM